MTLANLRYLRILRRALALGLTISIGAVSALSQSGRRPPSEPSSNPQGQSSAHVPNPDGGQESDVQLGTQEVLLSITVRDAAGRPVSGLTKDDFIVAEDRVGQTIVSFESSRAPVNVLLLLDASGSVFSELASIRQAAAKFVERLGPEDRVAVIQFADKVELLQDWTSDRDAIRLALNWRYRGGEATAFWDGVYLAADEEMAKVEGRKALIILSDGVDTSSKVTEGQAQAALDRADTSLYVVSKASAEIAKLKPYAGKGGVLVGTAPIARQGIEELTAAEEKMRALADRYGGRLYAPIGDEDLAEVYGQVADEIKQQYALSYVPTDERRDGRWRAIDVYLRRPGMTARTRKGYVAE